ncbi:MAG: hypothetical protein ACTSPA_14205 [Promethearchaeota archaeon]
MRITKLTPKANYKDKSKIDLTATSSTEISIIESESQLEISLIKINDLFEKGGFGNIEGKIQEIEDIKSIALKSGETKELQKIILADETGAIRVAIWGDKVNSDLKVDDSIQINRVNVKMNSYSNEMEASLSPRSSIEILKKIFETDKTLNPIRKTQQEGPSEKPSKRDQVKGKKSKRLIKMIFMSLKDR